MGVFTRMRVVLGSVITIGFVAVLFNQIGRELISRAQNQNGPFTEIANQAETMVPLVLVLLLLAIIVWMIASSVSDEKTVQRRPPR